MFRLKIGNALIRVGLLREQDNECDDQGPSADEQSVLILQAINQLGVTIMSQIDELKTAVAEQSAALAAAKQRIDEDVARLEDELADALADKPELAEVLADIRTTTQALNTLDPVVDALPDDGGVTPPPTDTTGGETTPPTGGTDGEAGPVTDDPEGVIPGVGDDEVGGDAGPVTETPADETNTDGQTF